MNFMKRNRVAKIKKWQLLRFKSKDAVADLSALEALTVGRRAFFRKKGLREVTLPAELSAVKTEAFLRCRELTRVTFGKQNTVGISEKAFFGCSSLHRVENSEMIFSVGAYAFANCSALEEIPFGRDLRRIGERAFFECRALTTLCIPSSVDRIGKNAFGNCSKLSEITLQEGLTTLAPNLFCNCSALTRVDFPESLSSVSAGAFRNCSALQELKLPLGIRRIEKKAFFGCANLRRVEISLGCERIGKRAFAGCTELTAIHVPRTLKRLGFAAFGLGKKQEKILLYVENEYMLRRIKRLLFFCGSRGRAEAVLVGKTVEQRKRERRRGTIEKTPVHLIDPETDFRQKPIVDTVVSNAEDKPQNINTTEQTAEENQKPILNSDAESNEQNFDLPQEPTVCPEAPVTENEQGTTICLQCSRTESKQELPNDSEHSDTENDRENPNDAADSRVEIQ